MDSQIDNLYPTPEVTELVLKYKQYYTSMLLYAKNNNLQKPKFPSDEFRKEYEEISEKLYVNPYVYVEEVPEDTPEEETSLFGYKIRDIVEFDGKKMNEQSSARKIVEDFLRTCIRAKENGFEYPTIPTSKLYTDWIVWVDIDGQRIYTNFTENHCIIL
jgi:hypothetical protein